MKFSKYSRNEKQYLKKNTRLAFINADRRDFQNCPASKEDPQKSVLCLDHLEILAKSGWTLTHVIQAPVSSQPFAADVVTAMQKKKILGVTSRYVLILR